MEKTYYIYILRSMKNTLYTGITTDIKRRIYEHMNDVKKGAKYTKVFKVKKVELVLTVMGRSAASKIECYIKTFSHSEKEMFLKQPKILIHKLLLEKNINADIYICPNKTATS